MLNLVKCVVTGHSNGPLCELCNKKMDTVSIADKNSKLFGQAGAYCWGCLKKKS